MPEPRIIVADDSAALAQLAAEQIASILQRLPAAAVLIATGNTPMRTYEQLAAMNADGRLDTSQLRSIQLDEYVGLDRDDARSLASWMRRSFTHPLGIGDDRGIWLDLGDNPDEACRSFEHDVRTGGGIDLAILGLGPNAHLGFNEPPSPADAPSRVVDLAPESLVSNAAYWGSQDAVPRQAATAGMGLIMGARHVILLVSGAHKQTILNRVLTNQPDEQLPASLLRLRSGVTVLCDQPAWGEQTLRVQSNGRSDRT